MDLTHEGLHPFGVAHVPGRVPEVELGEVAGQALAEFDFRYTTRGLTDTQRLARLMGQTGGRLTYRPMVSG